MTQPRSKEASSRWSFMRMFIIGNETDGVYLRRLRIVQTPRFAVYLHRFERPDSEPDMHDHPWPFATVILRGGYTERWTSEPKAGSSITRRWRRGSFHRIGLAEAHSIVTIAPRTMTLILTGREVRDWGFWAPTGWVPWQDYLIAADPAAAMS